MEKVTIILAGNHRQYLDWLCDNKLGKEDLDKYRYGGFPERVQSLTAKEVIVIGTFWEDFPRAREMYDLALSRVRD